MIHFKVVLKKKKVLGFFFPPTRTDVTTVNVKVLSLLPVKQMLAKYLC